MSDNQLLSQTQVDEIFDTFFMWEPTDDTCYSDSRLGEYTLGGYYERMLVEQGPTGQWHASMYTISERDEETGEFSYDLFPDDDDDMYIMVDEEQFPTVDEAKAWLESRDTARTILEDGL
jgi:hypothetical protein